MMVRLRLRQLSLILLVLCISYFVVLFIVVHDDSVRIEEPLQNFRFNKHQVRDSNLLLADDLIHVDLEPQNQGFFHMFIDKPTESSWLKEMREKLRGFNNPETTQDEPDLIRLLKEYWIRPPSLLPYSLENPSKKDFSMGQSMAVDKILKSKRHGFFVECGALDGETRSNSLFFERERNWGGLLIEAGPINYRKLVKKNRVVHSTPACLGTKSYPNVMYFNRGQNRGRLINNEQAFEFVAQQKLAVQLMEVQCFPLYSLLLSLNRTRVDYLSLDVEGVELEVLKTIPFDKLHISVLSVEYAHDAEGEDAMKKFMDSKGYVVHSEIKRDDHLAHDFLFVKKELLEVKG